MYPSDFNTAEAVYAPTEGDLFLGVPPLLGLALLLVLLAVAVAAYRIGRGQALSAGGSDADRAPEEIHKAILAASTAAMAASSDELKFRAQALRTAVHDHLGPVLDLAKGLSGLAKALDEALKGEIKTEPKPAPPTPAPAAAAACHEPKAHQGCGCGQPKACTCAGPSAPAITVTHVTVGGPPPACGCPSDHKPGCDQASAKPDKPAPEAKAEMRAMTGPEQIDALSRAVRQFHDHWSRGPDRVRELQLARAALCRRPPTPKPEKQGAYIWDRQ